VLNAAVTDGPQVDAGSSDTGVVRVEVGHYARASLGQPQTHTFSGNADGKKKTQRFP
jgi:hypothetical protein